ncbi:MAG: hypothetical protein LW595_04120 [Rickettsiales bacterium]|jgi:hypothetical protein|nr:hypothetical protein [Rickettsiales bacterium]
MNKENNNSLQECDVDSSINQELNKNNDLKLEKIAKIVAVAMFFILSILVFYIFLTFFNKKEIITKPIKSNIVNIKLNGKVIKTSLEDQFIIIETAYNPSSKTQEIIKIDNKNGNEISRIILNF